MYSILVFIVAVGRLRKAKDRISKSISTNWLVIGTAGQQPLPRCCVNCVYLCLCGRQWQIMVDRDAGNAAKVSIELLCDNSIFKHRQLLSKCLVPAQLLWCTRRGECCLQGAIAAVDCARCSATGLVSQSAVRRTLGPCSQAPGRLGHVLGAIRRLEGLP